MHGASLLCCWSISGEMRREIVLTKTVVSLNFVIRWNTVCTVQAFRGISGEMRLEIVLTKTVVSLNLIIRWNTVCAVWRHYFMRQTAPNPNPLRQTSSSFWLLRCLYAASCLVSAPAAVRSISFFNRSTTERTNSSKICMMFEYMCFVLGLIFVDFGKFVVWWLVCKINRRQIEVCFLPGYNSLWLTGLKVQTN